MDATAARVLAAGRVCAPAAAASSAVAGLERVVDEQHHAPARIVLQRRAQQRVPHHVGLFLIRRHEDGQRRRGSRVEAALDLFRVGGDVAGAALEVTEARQLIDHTAVDQSAENDREQQQADDVEQGAPEVAMPGWRTVPTSRPPRPSESSRDTGA